MTSDQASDLKSYIDRVVRCEIELERAANARDSVKHDLNNFMYQLQHPPQDPQPKE